MRQTYQVIARRAWTCGRTGSGTTPATRGWTGCGLECDLVELNGWTSPRMLRRYGASARSARPRRTYDRIMADTSLTRS